MTRQERYRSEAVMNALLAILERLKLNTKEHNALQGSTFLYSIDQMDAYEVIALETSILRSHRIKFKKIADTINKALKELPR